MTRTGLGLIALAACTTVGGSTPPPSPAQPVTAQRSVPPSQPVAQAPVAPRDPPRLLTDPGSGVEVVWAGSAVDTEVIEQDLVVLEPDGRHLGAVDWRTGQAQWRIELAIRPSAQLHGLGDRVLVHDLDRAIVVEGARGRVLGRHPAPVAGRWPQGHGADRRRGACAWVGPCGIQAFSCEDGAARGEYFASTEIHAYMDDADPSEHETLCSPQPAVLGRHDAIIALLANATRTDETGRPAGSMPVVIGLDATTGERRWQHGLPDSEPRTGMSDDGGCWILDTDTPRLQMLDSNTGTLRWERPLGQGRLEIDAVDDTLVVARHHGGRWRLSAYATDDGRPAWSVRLPRRQAPVLPDAPIRNAHATGDRRVYALIDPERGAIAGQLSAGRDEELWRDPAGGFVLIGRDVREMDAQGRLTRQRPFTALRAHTVTREHVLTDDGDAIEVFDREQLRERARIEGRLSIESTVLPDDRLLLRRYGEDSVALVLGLDPPARAGRR